MNIAHQEKNLLLVESLLLIILGQEECHLLIKQKNHHDDMTQKNLPLRHHDMMLQLFLAKSLVLHNHVDLL